MYSAYTSVADTDPFDTDPDPAFHFDPDPDPYHFKEVMYRTYNSTFYTSLLDFHCQ
jgi:hypothetical protein